MTTKPRPPGWLLAPAFREPSIGELLYRLERRVAEMRNYYPERGVR